jgi:predicted O-methyltransferase YrrM
MPELAAYTQLARHVGHHPRHASMLSRWYRERRASPLDLRFPWWPYSLVPWLVRALPAGAQAFEFGSGGSTLWLSDHGYAVTSVESDPGWHRLVAQAAGPAVTVMLIEPGETGTIGTEVEPGFFDEYVHSIDAVPASSLDLVIVDGRCRVACLEAAVSRITSGGLMLLDDSDRPRYAATFDVLAAWPRFTFSAPGPGRRPPTQSTVWRKP